MDSVLSPGKPELDPARFCSAMCSLALYHDNACIAAACIVGAVHDERLQHMHPIKVEKGCSQMFQNLPFLFPVDQSQP